jgi:hypothetical protein
VFAGAMLGAPACKAKPATTTPNNAQKPSTTPEANAKPDPTKPGDPADPCTGDPAPDRVRGADDDGGGGTGRGFVLS